MVSIGANFFSVKKLRQPTEMTQQQRATQLPKNLFNRNSQKNNQWRACKGRFKIIIETIDHRFDKYQSEKNLYRNCY